MAFTQSATTLPTSPKASTLKTAEEVSPVGWPQAESPSPRRQHPRPVEDVSHAEARRWVGVDSFGANRQLQPNAGAPPTCTGRAASSCISPAASWDPEVTLITVSGRIVSNRINCKMCARRANCGVRMWLGGAVGWWRCEPRLLLSEGPCVTLCQVPIESPDSALWSKKYLLSTLVKYLRSDWPSNHCGALATVP
jgi:hypothetical protein